MKTKRMIARVLAVVMVLAFVPVMMGAAAPTGYAANY